MHPAHSRRPGRPVPATARGYHRLSVLCCCCSRRAAGAASAAQEVRGHEGGRGAEGQQGRSAGVQLVVGLQLPLLLLLPLPMCSRRPCLAVGQPCRQTPARPVGREAHPHPDQAAPSHPHARAWRSWWAGGSAAASAAASAGPCHASCCRAAHRHQRGHAAGPGPCCWSGSLAWRGREACPHAAAHCLHTCRRASRLQHAPTAGTARPSPRPPQACCLP